MDGYDVKLFLDTEFTGLNGLKTSLISIALVSSDFLNNRSEGIRFYAEFNDYDKNNLDSWIVENVINNCMYNDKNEYFERAPVGNPTSAICSIKMKNYRENIIDSLIKWIENCFGDHTITVVSDCGFYDFVLFQDLFGGAFNMPKRIEPMYHDINADIMNYYNITDNEAFNLNRQSIIDIESIHMKKLESFDKTLQQLKSRSHNALYDALRMKLLNDILQKRMEQRREYNE